MSRITDMKNLSGEIRVMLNSHRVDGPDIAKKLVELAQIGRDAVGVTGDLDVTFDAANAIYVMTLKRPHPRVVADKLCASLKLLDPNEQIPLLHSEVVYALNRLDSILNREERRLGRSRIR